MPLPPTFTVTVRAEEIEDLAVAVTVTEVALAPSPTLDGFADRVIAYLSSSVSVRDVPVTEWPPLLLPDTETALVALHRRVLHRRQLERCLGCGLALRDRDGADVRRGVVRGLRGAVAARADGQRHRGLRLHRRGRGRPNGHWRQPRALGHGDVRRHRGERDRGQVVVGQRQGGFSISSRPRHWCRSRGWSRRPRGRCRRSA